MNDRPPIADQIAIARIVARDEPELRQVLQIERHQHEADVIELGDRAATMHLFAHVVDRILGLGWFVCNVRGDFTEEDTP